MLSGEMIAAMQSLLQTDEAKKCVLLRACQHTLQLLGTLPANSMVLAGCSTKLAARTLLWTFHDTSLELSIARHVPKDML